MAWTQVLTFDQWNRQLVEIRCHVPNQIDILTTALRTIAMLLVISSRVTWKAASAANPIALTMSKCWIPLKISVNAPLGRTFVIICDWNIKLAFEVAIVEKGDTVDLNRIHLSIGSIRTIWIESKRGGIVWTNYKSINVRSTVSTVSRSASNQSRRTRPMGQISRRNKSSRRHDIWRKSHVSTTIVIVSIIKANCDHWIN